MRSRILNQSKFNHQLTAVADAEGEGVLAGIELVERLLGLRVEEEGTRPALGRTEHVAVGEATAEDDEVDILERLAPRDEVGHHHVLHVEAGQIHGVGHLALAVGTLLTDDGSLGTHGGVGLLPSVGVQTVLSQFACEALRELHLQWLFLIVLVALASLAVEALSTVEQIARLVPHVAQVVDVELQTLRELFADHLDAAAVLDGIADLGEAHAALLHELAELLLVLVAHLDDHARVLGEERLDDVALGAEVVQVDVHAALRVGEAHLQQGHNQTAGRDVVACHDPSALDEFLNRHERVGKVFGILHRRHVVAHLAEGLREGRTAQSLFIEREVDMIDGSVLVVDQHGRHHFLYVAHLAASRHDDRSRRDDLLTVGILLRERERVLARRHVDVQFAAEVAQCLDGSIESCVLAFL